MATDTVQKGGTKGKAGAGVRRDRTEDDTATFDAAWSRHRATANALAEVLSDPAVSETIKNALITDLRDFARKYGGILNAQVLRLAYPALCHDAGFDPLAATLAALRRPRGVKPLPVGVPVALERVPRSEDAELDFVCPTHALRGLGVEWGDTLRDADRGVRRPEVKTGDVVVLRYRGQDYAGVLQERDDKVLLLSTNAGDRVRRFDRDKVKLVMRVGYILKHIPRGVNVYGAEGGAK